MTINEFRAKLLQKTTGGFGKTLAPSVEKLGVIGRSNYSTSVLAILNPVSTFTCNTVATVGLRQFPIQASLEEYFWFVPTVPASVHQVWNAREIDGQPVLLEGFSS